MKTYTALLIVCLALLGMTFACKDQGSVEPAPADTTNWPTVRKPNIYLYPETTSHVSVQVVFPQGGRIIESEPDYGSGWIVSVQPDGKINEYYDYLYYEAQTPDRYQYSSGWLVHRDTLEGFFVRMLSEVGFSAREISDFIDYWNPLLDLPLYAIFPQDETVLEDLIRLRVEPVPDSQLRMFFVLKPIRGEPTPLTSPVLATRVRSGFILAEWGVIVTE